MVALKDGHEITAQELQIDTGQRDLRFVQPSLRTDDHLDGARHDSDVQGAVQGDASALPWAQRQVHAFPIPNVAPIKARF